MKPITDPPSAQSPEVLREVGTRDQEYQRLMGAAKQGRTLMDRDKVPYMADREEPGVQEEMLCKGERIVILEGQDKKDKDQAQGGTKQNNNLQVEKKKEEIESWEKPDEDRDRNKILARGGQVIQQVQKGLHGLKGLFFGQASSTGMVTTSVTPTKVPTTRPRPTTPSTVTQTTEPRKRLILRSIVLSEV